MEKLLVTQNKRCIPMKRSLLFEDVCVCVGSQQEVASKYILRTD